MTSKSCKKCSLLAWVLQRPLVTTSTVWDIQRKQVRMLLCQRNLSAWPEFVQRVHISHLSRSAHSMRAKNGWDLMSSTPATPAPRRSAGLNCKSLIWKEKYICDSVSKNKNNCLKVPERSKVKDVLPFFPALWITFKSAKAYLKFLKPSKWKTTLLSLSLSVTVFRD